MKITITFNIEPTSSGRPGLPDPHEVAEALVEHLTVPADPDDLIFTVRQRGRRPVDLQYSQLEITSVEA